MKPEEITAGVELRIPAGADLTRSQTYYARVDQVADQGGNGYVHVFMTRMNAAGRPRSFGRPDGTRLETTGHAIILAELCSLRVPAPKDGPGTPYDSSGLLRPPAAAVGLSAIRGMPNGSMRQYSAVGFHSGWAGVEHTIRTLRAVGYVRPSSTQPSYAVLDVLDDKDDIIFDYDIPHARAFSYLKRRLHLVVEPEPDQGSNG